MCGRGGPPLLHVHPSSTSFWDGVGFLSSAQFNGCSILTLRTYVGWMEWHQLCEKKAHLANRLQDCIPRDEVHVG